MRRWAFNLLAALSLLLLVVVSAAWVRSYRALDQLYGQVWGKSFDIRSYGGACTITSSTLYRTRPGVDPRTTVDQAARPFDLLRKDEPPEFPRNYIARQRWPLGDTDRWQRRPKMFPRPEGRRWLAYARQGPGLYSSVWYIAVPYWLPHLAFALPPSLAAARAVRRYRSARNGRCVACGYDLRATPGGCPECGTPTMARR